MIDINQTEEINSIEERPFHRVMILMPSFRAVINKYGTDIDVIISIMSYLNSIIIDESDKNSYLMLIDDCFDVTPAGIEKQKEISEYLQKNGQQIFKDFQKEIADKYTELSKTK